MHHVLKLFMMRRSFGISSPSRRFGGERERKKEVAFLLSGVSGGSPTLLLNCKKSSILKTVFLVIRLADASEDCKLGLAKAKV